MSMFPIYFLQPTIWFIFVSWLLLL